MKPLTGIRGIQSAIPRTKSSERPAIYKTITTTLGERLHFRWAVVLSLMSGGLIAAAANKEKPVLPNYVLRAQTVLVIIDPDAGTSMTAPQANKTAQDDVEKALMKWGRLRPVIAGMPADLIITVRKGSNRPVEPTVGGEPTNDRPVIVQPTDSGIRIGAQQGRPPNQTQPAPQDTKPSQGMELGPTEDVFFVYDGSLGPNPDGAPVWHYSSKNALRSPDVPAVAEFRKAIEAALKQQQKNSKP